MHLHVLHQVRKIRSIILVDVENNKKKVAQNRCTNVMIFHFCFQCKQIYALL